MLRPENPAAEMNLNLAAPDRQNGVKALELKVKADVTVPAGLKTFQFTSLEARTPRFKKGDISVTLESTEVDEQVWKVNVDARLSRRRPGVRELSPGALQQPALAPEGRRLPLRAQRRLLEHRLRRGKLGFEYLFVDVPGKPADYGFVYETPSKVITIPLEFEFKDVPLP